MTALTDRLPKPQGKRVLIKSRQTTNDIITALLDVDYKNRIYKPVLKSYFTVSTSLLTNLRAGYDYTVRNLQYVKEGQHQTAKTLPVILHHGFGDCKHFALTLGSICRALNVPYVYRLTSYNKYDKTPTHIYVVAQVYGKMLILDGVIKTFGLEKPYEYAYDYKPYK